MPVLVREWNLTPGQTGMILSMGYLGQLIGAVCFGWMAEKIGRLKVLLFTILLFVSMDIACLFAAGAGMMMAFRFVQGIGTGGEVPVASAYINELIGSKGRGRFFLLYEVMFLLGLVGAGLIGYFMVPLYGWKAMFVVGLVPAMLMIPLRWFLHESPRWLVANGRYEEADRIVAKLENSARAAGNELPEPKSSPRPCVVNPTGASCFKAFILSAHYRYGPCGSALIWWPMARSPGFRPFIAKHSISRLKRVSSTALSLRSVA